MRFTDFPLHPALLQALETKGFADATPVQEAVLRGEHGDADLLVSSRTGSGKTLAFGLAASGPLLEPDEGFGIAGKPRMLVVAPTRELALQVRGELAWLFAPAGGRVASCVGGTDLRREQRALQQGAHVVVGTPGRLCDHLERRSLDLSELRVAVLDEADEMLDMGFRDELERILEAAPSERRTLLFSATLPRGIEELASRYQRNAQRIAATPLEQAHQDIEYRVHLIAPREREHAVVNVLRYHDVPRALVFVATRDGVTHLHASLAERGFSAVALSGELTQGERSRALQALRDGKARVLVATDVAARGLDLPEVGLVIHADLPMDAQVMQHRSGRTGRAGRKGVAVLLATPQRRFAVDKLLRIAKLKPTFTPVPASEEIALRDRAALIESIAAQTAEQTDEDLEVARALLASHGAEALVATLVKRERAERPAPEDLPATAALQDRAAKKGGERRDFDAAAPRPRFERGAGFERGRPFDGPAAFGRRDEGRGADGIWFRVNVGRMAHADPKWLIPMICRRGGISKADIGAIKIGPQETRFQISPRAAARFDEFSRRPDRKDPSIRFEPVS